MHPGDQYLIFVSILVVLLVIVSNYSPSSSPSPQPREVWTETPKTYTFKIKMAGYREEDISVELGRGRTLQISAQNKMVNAKKSLKENFKRSYLIPKGPKVKDLRVKLQKDVLTVTIYKGETSFFEGFSKLIWAMVFACFKGFFRLFKII